MSHAVNTFDVFDTLIARRSVEPHRALARLEARAALPGLAAARIAADQRLGGRGKPYHLADIWQEVRRATGLTDAAAGRLLDLEVQVEHDEVIPIVENLALVRDGDLLVSDTYLPADVVMSLLRTAGLQRQVGLAVSNDGKFRGGVWRPLLDHVRIGQHFGDNPHSDGRTPAAAGIKAVIYTGAGRSPAEQYLTEKGWGPLAELAREVRLANPFPPDRPRERHLWLAACQWNLPLLYLASLALERHCTAAGAQDVLFVSRDGLLWQHLYAALFPHRRSAYLWASRRCLLKPSADFLAYFRSVWRADAVVVDLFSTGASWARLFARLGERGRGFFIGRVDNYAYLPDGPKADDWVEMAAVCRTSEFGGPLGKGVEMLNYGPHGVVEDVRWLPGGVPLPVLAAELEYDPALPEAAHRAFRAGVERLPKYAELSRVGGGSVGELVRGLVGFICADPQLPAIYAGHHAADQAYLQRLLG